MLPVEGERKPFPFITSSFTDTAPQFSPDGRWVAYQSNESGPFDVFVVPFPGPGGRWQVSTVGAQMPRWRRDGREIFYTSPDGRLMAAAVDAQGTTFNVGTVRELFQLPRLVGLRYSYDITPDGSRFLVAAAGDQQTPLINLIVNWTASLKQ